MIQAWTMTAGLAMGGAAGMWTAIGILRPKLMAERRGSESQAANAAALERQLQDLHTQISALRHDLRGILAPALLAADRLVNSEDPAIRKTGDIVVRTVERATARLAETRLGKEISKSL